jgi:hypothetical protein
MNGSNDNNINPEVVRDREVTNIQRTSVTVDTKSGAAWVRKYLHPPCATPDDYAGYPDTNNSPSTDAEYKGLRDIKTFSTAGNPAITTYYDKVLLLHTSSAIAPVIPFKYTTDGTLVQLGSDVILNRNINVQDMVAQNSSGRISYKSTTSWLNATGFNNQGNVTTAQFRPNISVWPVVTALERVERFAPEDRLRALRCFARDFAPSDEDDFEVIDDVNVAPALRIRSIEAQCSVLRKRLSLRSTTAVNDAIQVLILGNIPTDPSQILMMSPNAVAESAKDGSFVVQRFSQPEIPYKDFAATGLIKPGGVSELNGMPCYYFTEATSTTGQLVSLDVDSQPGNKTGTLVDLPWFDFLWGWTLYEGLSVVNGGSATVTPPYISVKTITGFEFQPLPDSMLSPFIRNSAVYDMSALRLATMSNHAIADSLPAAANFWGSVGKVLLQAAPSIISTILGLFGSKKQQQPAPSVKSVTQSMGRMSMRQPKPRTTNVRVNTGSTTPLARRLNYSPRTRTKANRRSTVPSVQPGGRKLRPTLVFRNSTKN